VANTGIKGVDVLQTSTAIVFEAFLTVSGAAFSAGPVYLRIAERQTDGTIKTYDFTSSTFKTSGMTSGGQYASMTERTLLDYSGGDASLHVGLWTYALSTLSGFTTTATYYAVIVAAGTDTPLQIRKFQFGGAEGDMVVTMGGTSGYLRSDVQLVNAASTISFGGNMLLNVHSAGLLTVSSATSNTVVLSAVGGLPATGYLAGCDLLVYSGTGKGGILRITAWNSSTKTFTLDGTWPVTPDNTSQVVVLMNHAPALDNSLNVLGVTNPMSLVTGAIDVPQLSAGLAGALLPAFTVTGTTTPATADNWICGGIYAGLRYYKSTTLGTPVYCWYNGTGYTISTVLGTAGASYFTSGSNGFAGPYTAAGSALGTPVLTIHGNAMLTGYQPEQACLAGAYATANVSQWAGQTAAVGSDNLPKVAMWSILGTGLSESTTGWIAAAFKKFFNIGTPTLTTGGTDQTGDSYGRIGANGAGLTAVPDTSGTTTLLSRLSAARAGYLDNLNVGGVVASHADVTSINLNASKHLTLMTVGQYQPGESYVIECRTYSAADGSVVNADSSPTLTATGTISGSLAANLGTVTNPATGVYRWTYSTPSSPTLEQIRFDVSATISSATFTLSAYTQTVDFATVVFTSTDQSHLTAIYNKLPANNIADESLLLAAIGSPFQATSDFNTAQKASLNAATPASVTGAVGSVTGNVGGSVGSVTGNIGGNVVGSVGSVTTVSDKTGYSLTSGNITSIATAVWSTVITAGTSAGTILSSLYSYLASYLAAPTASQNATATAAAILATPANKLVTNADGTVNLNSGSSAVNIVVPPDVAQASIDPTMIALIGGVTNRYELTLGTVTGYSSISFAVKKNKSDSDAAALIMLTIGGGMITVDGAAASSSLLGSITLHDSTTGDATVVINSAAGLLLTPTDGRDDRSYWGAKVSYPDGTSKEPQSGRCSISWAVDQSV